jgi:hypothetical protein
MAKRVTLSPDSVNKLTTWYHQSVLSGTPILQHSIFGWLFGLFKQHGVTINKTIHLTNRAPKIDSDSWIALIGHELIHVLQQQEMGWWKFLAKYIWHWRPKHINRGREHPLEKRAYARQDEIEEFLQI